MLRKRVIAYCGFNQSGPITIVDCEPFGEPSSKRPADCQGIADCLVKLSVIRQSPERSIDYPLERPFLVDVMGDEVASRVRIELDYFVGCELLKSLFVLFDSYEETTRSSAPARNLKKTPFALSMYIVFLI